VPLSSIICAKIANSAEGDAIFNLDERQGRFGMGNATLYDRLGGYDAITAFADNLMPRLMGDAQMGRFWQNRGADGIAREKQLLIDYLCSVAGGPVYYTGRDMKLSHDGMKISESDWEIFLGHAADTMHALNIPQQECDEIVAFVLTLKDDIVEAA
jgi:hemoglobin